MAALGEAQFVGKTRKRVCELRILNRADGSARFQQGLTSVMAGVYGPVEVKQNKERPDGAHLEVNLKAITGAPSVKERALEDILTSTCREMVLLEQYPHSLISVNLQVEVDNGSLLSTLCNASCMSLLDCGVPMKGMFSCVTCAWSEEGQLVIDPTSDQESSAKGIIHVAINCHKQTILTVHTLGNFTIDQFQQSISMSKSVSQSLLDFYRECNSKKLSKYKTVLQDVKMANKV